MARKFIGFLVVTFVIGGFDRNSLAQVDPERRDRQEEAKPPKVKLFEVPGVGGKISKSALGDIFDALRDKNVQQEIGLLGFQLKELQRLSGEVMKELGPRVETFNALSKTEQDAKVEQLRTDLATYMRGVEADVDKILAPEQQQRLKEVVFQLRMQRNGATQTFASPDVLRELGLSDAQADRFREELSKIEEQHRLKLADLEMEKERKILAIFSPNQRDRLQSMIGSTMRNLEKSPANPKAQ